MGARTKRNGFSRNCKNRCVSPDLFGFRIGFNVEGEEVHRTIPGAILSLFIIAWLIVVLNYLVLRFDENVRTINKFTPKRPLDIKKFENYYGEENTPIAFNNFRFAVGLSSIHDFADGTQSTSAMLDYSEFKALIVPKSRSKAVGNTPVRITLRPCSDTDWELFSPINKAQESQFNAHKAANQFWCVDPTKIDVNTLKVINTYESLDHQMIEIFLESCYVAQRSTCKTENQQIAYYEKKHIMFVTQTQRIDTSVDKIGSNTS